MLFACRLALAMGQLSVARMLRSMTGRDLRLWQTFYSLEPFGEQRADLRVGILCTLVAAACGDKHATPAKYMPYLKVAERRQSIEQQRSIMMGLWKESVRGQRHS